MFYFLAFNEPSYFTSLVQAPRMIIAELIYSMIKEVIIPICHKFDNNETFLVYVS